MIKYHTNNTFLLLIELESLKERHLCMTYLHICFNLAAIRSLLYTMIR